MKVRIRYTIALIILGVGGVLLGQVTSTTYAAEVNDLYQLYLEREFDAFKETLEGLDRDEIAAWNNPSKELYWSLYTRYYAKVEEDLGKYAMGLVPLGAFEDAEGAGQYAKTTKVFLEAYLWYQESKWMEADSVLDVLFQHKDLLAPDPVLESEVYLLAAIIESRQANRAHAVAAYKKAVAVLDAADAYARSANAARYLAEYFADIREPNEALLYLRNVAKATRRPTVK